MAGVEIIQGLTKRITADGSGPLPAQGDKISAHYTGRLLDGTVFDSSVSRGKPFEFTLGVGQVIRAWDAAFATMAQGEKAVITCAPEIAYGAAGSPPVIPPGATLEFDVELLSFGPPPKEVWQMDAAERLAVAAERKDAGNKAFTGGDAAGAFGFYSTALSTLEGLGAGVEDTAATALNAAQRETLRSLQAVINSNMAAVLLKQQRYAEAADRAGRALAADPGNAKATFRRGVARAHLGELEAARADLVAAAKLAPADAGIRAEHERVVKLLEGAKARERAAYGGMFASSGAGASGSASVAAPAGKGKGKAKAAAFSLYDDKPLPPSTLLHAPSGPLPHVFFDLTHGGRALGRVVMKLYSHVAPKTVANFQALIKGDQVDSMGKPMRYKNAIFHRVIRSFMAQGGDYANRNGTGGESIYGPKFADEVFTPHDRPWLLSMANSGKDTNGSQFFITFVPCPHLDGKHVVFGEIVLVAGAKEVLAAIESAPVKPGDSRPQEDITIADCGTLTEAEVQDMLAPAPAALVADAAAVGASDGAAADAGDSSASAAHSAAAGAGDSV